MKKVWLALLLLALAGCDNATTSQCLDKTAPLIAVPASWAAEEVLEVTVQWHVIENRRIECGDKFANGCARYGSGWPDAPTAIAAPDPLEYGFDTPQGQEYMRLLGHEFLHAVRGSFHD